MAWLLRLLDQYGITDSSNRWGAFWSGFCSDLSSFTLIGAIVEAYRRHTCHVNEPRFCWRPGTHPVAGTPFRACRKHHPAVPNRISAEHIQAAHDEAHQEAQ